MGAARACCAGWRGCRARSLESRAHPAPPSARRGAGRGRLRLGAAGVGGGAARLPDGDPGAEQPARASPTACSGGSCAACSSRSTRRPPASPAARCASWATRCAARSSTASRPRARRPRPADAIVDPGRQPGLARGQRAGVRDGAGAGSTNS